MLGSRAAREDIDYVQQSKQWVPAVASLIAASDARSVPGGADAAPGAAPDIESPRMIFVQQLRAR
jgi:hypothetical protein